MSEHSPTRRQSESKRDLRRRFTALRRQVTLEERDATSAEIARKLFASVPWQNIRAMHIYSSVPNWREIDTEPIVLGVREAFPDIEMTRPGTTKNEPVPKTKFDLIVVPVLAFDSGNYRLGLGAGFYDRFLADQLHALTIGLAYRWARLSEDLPREPHDVPLDRILTDT
jgi:5-formyltetrahydrofolate cyclo-ligase